MAATARCGVKPSDRWFAEITAIRDWLLRTETPMSDDCAVKTDGNLPNGEEEP